ncbi:hypothetical protein DNTS_014080, partial [Danionella cerebrum]
TSPGLSNSCGVAQHAHGPLYFSQISTWNHSGRLVVDANLETSGTPVHKLDCTLGLDGGNSTVHIFGHHITTVQQTASHVLAVTWITLHHLIGWLEASIDHWGIRCQWEVDTWIGHQVGLELCEIDIESTIEPKRGCDGGHNLTDQPVEVCVRRTLNIEVPSADVINGLIVDHEGTVRVFEGGVGGQDGVVRLYHSGGDLRSWVDGELQLGLLAVVDRETFHQQRGEARAGSTTKAVEHQESLETCALVYEFFSDGVMTTSVIVGCIFFSCDELLGMEELTKLLNKDQAESVYTADQKPHHQIPNTTNC